MKDSFLKFHGAKKADMTDIDKLLDTPELQRLIKRLSIRTYDEFVEQIYVDLRRALKRIESNVNYWKNPRGEDEITADLTNMLYMNEYTVSQDINNRGHADIIIIKGEFKWIGEAKIYTNYKWLFKGLSQLLCRYMSGAQDETSGAILIYFIGPDVVKTTMDNWDVKLNAFSNEIRVRDRILLESTNRVPQRVLEFYSNHIHSRSGLPVKILHIPVLLNFSPIDKTKKK